MIAVSLCCQQV